MSMTIEQWKAEYSKVWAEKTALEKENNRLQDMIKIQTRYNSMLQRRVRQLEELTILNHIADEMIVSGDLNENAEINCDSVEFEKLMKDLEKLK